MQIRRAAATAREALLQRAADKLKVAKDTLDGPGWRGHVADRRRQAFVSATDRRATACDENRSRGAAEGPQGLHDRGHFRAAPRHPRQRSSGPSTSSRTTSCRACCMRVWFIQPAFARRSKASTTPRGKIKGYVRAVRKGNLLAVVATNEWAAITRLESDRCQVVGLGRTTRGVAALRVRAQLEGRPQRGAANGRRHGRRVQARQTNAAGDVRLRDANPRIDRPILRSRRFQGRPADRMDALAGKPSAASAARDDAELEARERALHLLWKVRAATAATAPTTALPKQP